MTFQYDALKEALAEEAKAVGVVLPDKYKLIVIRFVLLLFGGGYHGTTSVVSSFALLPRRHPSFPR